MKRTSRGLRDRGWPRGPASRRAILVFACFAIVLTSAAQSVHAQQSQIPDTIAQRAIACAACHGKEGRATNDGFFPRIAGKPARYLYNQLVNFRDGRRQNPQMTYMVGHMSNAFLQELAEYFASLHPPYPPPQVSNAASAG